MSIKDQELSTTSPLRYPGGKFRARKLLKEFVPEGTTRVLAPFFGGGSFELFLTANNMKVYGYDAFIPLSNFWEHLLKKPRDLAKMVRKYGQINSTEFKKMQKTLIENETSVSSLEDAAKFFIVNRCSFSGATLSGGYSKASATTRFTESSIKRIEEFNNNLLSVETKIFQDSLSSENLKKVKPNLLFLDPPYLLDSKAKNTLYGVGGSLHKSFDHKGLYEILKNNDIPFIITYNNSPEIRELYKSYHIYDLSWSYGMNTSKESSEIVITNHSTKPIL